MRYVLIDTSNMFFRARHQAHRASDTWTKLGFALHLTIMSANKVARKFNADHIVFALEGRSWRKDAYKPYKANRTEARQALNETEAQLKTWADSNNPTIDKTYTFEDPTTNIKTSAEITVNYFNKNLNSSDLKAYIETSYVKEIRLDGWSGNIKLCWDNKDAAMSYVLYNNTGITKKALLKPNDSFSNKNNMSGDVNATADATYGFCTNVNVATATTPSGIRVRALYNNTNIYVIPSIPLPNQGYEIISTGKLVVEGKTTTVKTIRVYRSYSYSSGIFEDGIYTNDTLFN